MKDRRLIEQIDACRPGSDDVHDRTLATLAADLAADSAQQQVYDRVQSLDRAISRAMDDVPVPPGVADRMLARLNAHSVVSAAEVQTAPTNPTTPRSTRARTWSLALGTAASVAAALAFVLWMRSPALTAATLTAEVLQYQDEPLTGEPTARTLPVGYPLSRYVHRLPQTMWRPLYGFLHRPDLNGVAYDLNFNGATATLYVVPAQVKYLPASPPLRTGATTGNRAVAAWQESGLLYVLVVHGDDRTYQSFVRKPTVG